MLSLPQLLKALNQFFYLPWRKQKFEQFNESKQLRGIFIG